jgi:TolB-like protein
MNTRYTAIFTIALLLPLCTLNAQASSGIGQANISEKATTETPETAKVSVAIIDFESQAPGNPELGTQLSDILTARLSIYDQFQLVERKKLEDILKEQQLNLTGMVETQDAVKVGKLVGAKILIFGRAFAVDRDLYIVAKIVGTETSQVKGTLAKGSLESNLSEIIDQIANDITEGLNKWATELLPKSEKLNDKVVMLKQRLEGKKLPTVAIMITETHANRQVAASPDPAAQTEFKKIFKEVGFELIETNKEELAKWTKDFSLAGVDIVITGEGFSEFGTRINGLVSCSARLETQATNREDHKIIVSERTTRRAVDLSESIAAKTALQAAGRELAIKTIEKIADKLEN